MNYFKKIHIFFYLSGLPFFNPGINSEIFQKISKQQS